MPARSSATTRAPRSVAGTSPVGDAAARGPRRSRSCRRRPRRSARRCSCGGGRGSRRSARSRRRGRSRGRCGPSAASAVRSRPNSSSAGVLEPPSCCGARPRRPPPASRPAASSRAQTSQSAAAAVPGAVRGHDAHGPGPHSADGARGAGGRERGFVCRQRCSSEKSQCARLRLVRLRSVSVWGRSHGGERREELRVLRLRRLSHRLVGDPAPDDVDAARQPRVLPRGLLHARRRRRAARTAASRSSARRSR